jgi:2',3'-cyclic-nucleotide 2'-phosphodiesterase (5'-nucleotidase family)
MTISRRWRRTYGRMGGLDRVATVVKAIRADRPDALLLDGGDTWQGSLHRRSGRKGRTWSR